MTIATQTPIRISDHGSSALMIPSTSIFIIVACGAGIASDPYPHALSRSCNTNPIAAAETTTPIISPICCFFGVAPTINPVFKSCEQSPAIAAMTQIIPPIAMAPVIPSTPVVPVAFRSNVAIRSVAIAIPDTGLLEDPMSPTIREETVAKKNPNTITIRAPIGLTGNAGTSQMAIPITRIITSKNGIGMSCSVRNVEALLFFFILCIACLKVFAMSGRLLIRLITPPVATAPAPIYLM